MSAIDQAEHIRIRVALARTFTPGSPVHELEMLRGRQGERTLALSAVGQVGRHAVIYGERGVGKTSLARFIHEIWTAVAKDADRLVAPRYNCQTGDTFQSVWANIAETIQEQYERREWEPPASGAFEESFERLRAGEATPHFIRRFFDMADKTFIVIIDEFDVIEDAETVQQFADTIKTLADNLVDATLIIVGVADTIDKLIEGHASIDRSLAQVFLPRMTTDEIRDIVETGVREVGMTIDQEATIFIARLAQGLPYYAHLLGLHSGLSALQDDRLKVVRDDVRGALQVAIRGTEESIRMAYDKATSSRRADSLFEDVLLASALAPTNEMGFFFPRQVVEPLKAVTSRTIRIPAFVQHLTKFTSGERGPVLQVRGGKYKRQYRFADPLLKVYAILRALDNGVIGEEALDRITSPIDEDSDGRQLELLD